MHAGWDLFLHGKIRAKADLFQLWEYSVILKIGTGHCNLD